MTLRAQRQTAALLEVLGVYLAGSVVNDHVVDLLLRWQLIAPVNPFALLTAHTSNADLLVASRQLFIVLILQYASCLLLIIPINWWYRRRGRAAYGLTRAGLSWKTLVVAGLATAALCEWPVLVHSLMDAIHPLGAMAPWRQAFFDMSWRRWQFWLFAAILSYALVPVLEELLFRGYYQRRLAEDWGNGPAIVGTACLFTFAHKQYLIANAYNITMVASLLCLALGLGIVFAWTRSLIPSIIAHALINVPMTPPWQAVLLALFVIGVFFALRSGLRATAQVFRKASIAACAVLAIAETTYVIAAQRIDAMANIAIGLLVIAVVLEVIDRRSSRAVRPAPVSA